MKKATKITIAAVLSIALIGATGAFAAKDRHGDHEEHADRAVWFIAKKLDLDTNQEQALSALKDQVLVVKTAMHSKMDATKNDVIELVGAESFDQGKALELINAKTATVDSVAPDLVIALGNFMDSLDSDQKQEILDFMSSHHDRKRGHWKH